MLADRLLDVLLEKLSPAEAERTFTKYGVPGALALDKEVLKQAWRKLAVAHHPDKATGNPTAMRDINAAYDVLKVAGLSTSRASSAPDDWWQPAPAPRPRPQGRGDGRRMWSDEDEERRPFGSAPWNDHPNVPPWAWAGWSGGLPPDSTIHQQNYRDLNFIKKTIWQKAGGRSPESHLECTFWNFDGRYLRGVFTVFASSQQPVMWEAAKAMREWDGAKEAVLMTVKGQPNSVYVIWYRLAGDIYGTVEPTGMHHNSPNSNPGNDQEFMQELSNALFNQFRGGGRGGRRA